MKRVAVSVVFALPDRQWVWRVELPTPARVEHAVAAARIQQGEIERASTTAPAPIPWDVATVGVFGETCSRDAEVREGDRVELYRPLAADPKESRRARVARLRAEKRAAKS
jgi:hypothetical protein